MKSTRIAIIGGGLSGLYAAHLLQELGMRDYVLLEARPEFGGRIVSAGASAHPKDELNGVATALDRFDMGPTWYWPEQQPHLERLIDGLGLQQFKQFDEGDMVVERAAHQAPVRIRAYASVPASVRLVGGTAALTDTLRRRLDSERIVCRQQVRRLHSTGRQVEVESEGLSGERVRLLVEHVMLAVPPRLAQASIEFTPALPAALARRWRDTPTWMAQHAKYVAVYDTPFWREQGLSSAARSTCGPLGEIYDASMPDANAALFGFFGIPAQTRRSVPNDQLRLHCRAQLVRLFGPLAAQPRQEFIKDWAGEPFTSTAADEWGTAHSGGVPETGASAGVWQGRLTGVASEWSAQFPGYVAGAIDAAESGVRAWVESKSSNGDGS